MKWSDETCECTDPWPAFRQGQPTYCGKCGRKFNCPAPDASNAEKESSAIGEPWQIGPEEWAALIQRLKSSESILRAQQDSIDDLTQAVKFLAQHVKTLTDALAEDQDPDQPISSYLSGKPV